MMDKVLSISKYAIILVFSFAAGIFTVKQFIYLYLANTVPAVVHTVTLDPPVIKSGDPLYAIADLTRYRYCRSSRDEFVADIATNTNQWHKRYASASTQLGNIKIRNKYEIPALPPGEYVLRMVNFYQCSTGDIHTTHGPDATFRVED